MKKSQSRIVATIEVAQIPDDETTRYVERFLSPHEVKSNAKAYLYPEVHATLSKMVRAMGISGVSIGSYASEIILDHIAKQHSVMRSVFGQNCKDLF